MWPIVEVIDHHRHGGMLVLGLHLGARQPDLLHSMRSAMGPRAEGTDSSRTLALTTSSMNSVLGLLVGVHEAERAYAEHWQSREWQELWKTQVDDRRSVDYLMMPDFHMPRRRTRSGDPCRQNDSAKV